MGVHDEIQKLHVIATAPELYSILVQQNAITTLLGLLSHENSGILSYPYILYMTSNHILVVVHFHNYV
jgi:hypothetical protein